MPENYTPAAAATGTWTEEEIRHQPRAWIRSLTNIDALRSALNNFLEPLLRKENLRIILTGAGTSAFIGDIIAPWLASHTGKNFSAVPTTDLVTNPMDYLNPAHPLLLISFGRSGNSPESVAAVELANQFVPECYHLPITCNEAGALYQNAINSDNAFALLTESAAKALERNGLTRTSGAADPPVTIGVLVVIIWVEEDRGAVIEVQP